MTRYCTKCGTKRRKTARFCPKCGFSFSQPNLPALSNQTSLSSFDPMRKLSRVIAEQQGWLRKNTLFRPLQELLDNVILHTDMERATNSQKEMVLAGYAAFTQERVEQVIDEVRQARRLADGINLTEIKRRDLEVEDIFAQREHQRRLERLREEHKHEKEVLELRAQLELVNAIIQSFNQVRMIQFQPRRKV
ncbi:MAG: zinc ribbon domain-containing protein [Chloroflexi bacterium]|nr:zinc ribbon domain-containing protein [Chloroflexota bacterium]